MESRMQAVLADREVYEELKAGGLLDEAERSLESIAPDAEVGHVDEREFAEGLARLEAGQNDPFAPSAAEAIIMRHGYPSLLVKKGTFEKPKLKVWQERLEPYRGPIDTAIAGVGRVELSGHPHFNWIGTAWVLDEETIVTNRHVAELFVDQGRTRAKFKPGIKASLDFREEHGNSDELVAAIKDIVHVEPRNGVDLALLRLDKRAFAKLGIEPLRIADRLDGIEYVGVIGYPAQDVRNDLDDQSRIFDDIYDVKRFAPGKIQDANAGSDAFTHICTTLGGNSGSTVIDVARGCAVGLHFGGREGRSNFAVKPQAILDRATRAQVRVRLCEEGVTGDLLDEPVTESPEALNGRPGFDPNFLGTDHLAVPLPQLNPLQMRHVARLEDGGIELKYMHFSLVMNAARRLAFYSAVNIDGTDLWHKRRGRDVWKTDARLPKDAQVDNALYRSNDFDRGHLVRRLDPVWGPKADAELAELDTFHYTNAAPQHKDLNQKIWLDLETHILEKAEDRDAKVSVLIGPVFGFADPRSKRQGLEEVGIPLGFWKVVASIGRSNRGRKSLQAQAFVIWQWDMFGDSDLELVFGQGFETYQLEIRDLERLTGLDFQTLRDADTFGEPSESVAESAAESIVGRRAFQGLAERARHIRAPGDVI
jgi:endonuclease G